MDFIFENPLARMYGPNFLALYFALYVLILFFTRYFLPERIGNKSKDESLLIPDQPEPYKIAYLRRGAHEVLILVIFNMIRRKYFSLGKTGKNISVNTKNKNIQALTTLEKDVYDCIDQEMSLSRFVKIALKDSKFRNHCEIIRQELEQENLIWAQQNLDSFKRIKDSLMYSLIILGFYKLVSAIIHNHFNILGIIIISSFGTYLFSRIKVDVMPTVKGNSFLVKLRAAFKPISGNKLLSQPLYIEQILLSIYGFEILANSAYVHFHVNLTNEIQPKPSINFETVYTSDSSSSGGSSCSSSGCSGGSGCGGGCGGCGGCS